MSETGLLEQFISAAQTAAATVVRIECTPEKLCAAVLAASGDADCILLAEPDFMPAGWFGKMRLAPGIVTSPSEEQLSSSEIGVSGAFAAVARTGSVCVRISGALEYSVGLFTRRHLVLLSAGSIVARPRDVFNDPRIKELGSSGDFVFITGPSATADMGSLVRGVHGPGSLHIIILDC